MPTPKSAVIRGLGAYVPERILTNKDLESIVDTTDEWIQTRTGIRERRIADPSQASSDLAVNAARDALDMAGWTPQDVDVIMVATVTPDYIFPSCACTVQGKLGASQAAAFDLSAACTGFLYGMNLARGLIVSGQAKRILLIGVETLSRITDYEDRSTCVLFGDGAGAAAIDGTREGEDGMLSVAIGADGDQGELLYMPGGGSRNPSTAETVGKRYQYLRMAGNEVFKIAVRGMEAIAREALDKANIGVEDLDLLVPHQANIRIIDATAKRLGVPPQKVMVTIDKFGNTSAASIPISMREALREKRLRKGMTVGTVAFGGGLTWGASVLRWEIGE